MSNELRVTSYELRVQSLKVRVEILKARIKVQKCELKSTSYKFKSTSYEIKPTSYQYKSTNSRIIKSMKTQVSSLQLYTRNQKIISDVINFMSQGILSKHLCKNFFLKNRMPIFLLRFEYKI